MGCRRGQRRGNHPQGRLLLTPAFRLAPAFGLDGRRALVTAATQGIGRAIALALAHAGAELVVHGVEPGGAENLARTLHTQGSRAQGFDADFSVPGAARGLAERALEAVGQIDILVSGAAIQVPGAWNRMDPADIARQVQVNLLSALDLFTALAPPMAERGWGRVLAIGSVQGTRPNSEMAAYAATKAAQYNIVRNLARQLAPRGVTVNEIAPGAFDTPRNAAALADPGPILARIPAGYVGQPQDCAGAALLLCSEAGRYITGISLPIDGGMAL